MVLEGNEEGFDIRCLKDNSVTMQEMELWEPLKL